MCVVSVTSDHLSGLQALHPAIGHSDRQRPLGAGVPAQSPAKPLVDSCGGYASAVGGQRRTVAARGEWLPDLILARLRIREVQALEVVGIGDWKPTPDRVAAGCAERTSPGSPCDRTNWCSRTAPGVQRRPGA